jgi:hypothetical protein
VVAQAVPSGVEAEADSQSALRGADQAAKRTHPPSETAITVVSVAQGAQAYLDAADSFQDTYLKPLRIFDAVIGEIGNVWTLLSIGTELI